MDFTYLNKACPKDAYLLPSINKLVDGALEAKFLSFIETFSSYNQIKMHLLDMEKMAFIMENANYYYNVIPFGLKNVEATYQRLMNKVFADHIGRMMEVYVDDMVAKTMGDGNHYNDLWEIFS